MCLIARCPFYSNGECASFGIISFHSVESEYGLASGRLIQRLIKGQELNLCLTANEHL